MKKKLINEVSKQMEENNKKFNKLIDSLLQRDVVNNTNQPQNVALKVRFQALPR